VRGWRRASVPKVSGGLSKIMCVAMGEDCISPCSAPAFSDAAEMMCPHRRDAAAVRRQPADSSFVLVSALGYPAICKSYAGRTGIYRISSWSNGNEGGTVARSPSGIPLTIWA